MENLAFFCFCSSLYFFFLSLALLKGIWFLHIPIIYRRNTCHLDTVAQTFARTWSRSSNFFRIAKWKWRPHTHRGNEQSQNKNKVLWWINLGKVEKQNQSCGTSKGFLRQAGFEIWRTNWPEECWERDAAWRSYRCRKLQGAGTEEGRAGWAAWTLHSRSWRLAEGFGMLRRVWHREWCEGLVVSPTSFQLQKGRAAWRWREMNAE